MEELKWNWQWQKVRNYMIKRDTLAKKDANRKIQQALKERY